MSVLVSVIVPVYNIEQYLEKCINSIQNQTYKNIEIILVDDGSTDGSGRICDIYSKLDNRILVIHKENGGLVSARQAGADVVTGDYVLNVDGDDWIETNYIEEFVKIIESYHPDIVACIGFYKDYIGYSKKCTLNKLSQNELKKMVLGENGFNNSIEFSLWLKCVKKKLYIAAQKSLDKRIKYYEDVACVVRMLANSDKIYFGDFCGYHYVQRQDSMVNMRNSANLNSDEIMLGNTLHYLDSIGTEKALNLKKIVMGYYCRGKILHDFASYQREKDDFLFPYADVKKSSRIIVYGAGLFGRKIVEYLQKSKEYELVGWTDSSVQVVEEKNVKYELLDDLLSEDYDKIVIATTKTLFTREIKEILIEKRVPENTISIIDDELLLRIIKNG